jgi:hypothetical protein
MEKVYETVKLTLPSVVLHWLSAKVRNRLVCRCLMQDGEFVFRTGWINLRVGLERMCLVKSGGRHRWRFSVAFNMGVPVKSQKIMELFSLALPPSVIIAVHLEECTFSVLCYVLSSSPLPLTVFPHECTTSSLPVP